MTQGPTAKRTAPGPALNSEPGNGCSAPASGGHALQERRARGNPKKKKKRKAKKRKKKKEKRRGGGRKGGHKKKKGTGAQSVFTTRVEEKKENSHLAFSVSPAHAVRVFYVGTHWWW